MYFLKKPVYFFKLTIVIWGYYIKSPWTWSSRDSSAIIASVMQSEPELDTVRNAATATATGSNITVNAGAGADTARKTANDTITDTDEKELHL